MSRLQTSHSGIVVGVTDLHLTTDAPERRTEDDILGALLTKLDFVYQTALSCEAEAIVCAGDFGEHYDWNSRSGLLRRVIAFLRERDGIPWITTLGEHDVWRHRTDSLPNSGLGVLEEAGLIVTLAEGEWMQLPSFSVHGFARGDDETKRMLLGEGFKSEEAKGASLALVHAEVGQTDEEYCYSIDKQKPKFDLALFGHIHDGFGVTETSTGCIAVNPGSLFRKTIADTQRIPKLVIFRSDDVFATELMDIPCRPADEAFDMATVEAQSHERGRSTVAAIEAAKKYEFEDVEVKVKRIDRKSGYRKNVVAHTIDRLRSVRGR